MHEEFSRYRRQIKTHSDYCYPDSEVLINKLNIQNATDLSRFEADITLQRQYELENESPVKGRFTSTHLKKIHRHIFQDVYEFAVKYRTEDMWKGDTFFCKSEYIAENLKTLLLELKQEKYLQNLGQHEYALRAAYYMAELNVIHPFREGNGRAIREFIRQLGVQAGYYMDWAKVEPKELLEASIISASGNITPLAACLSKACDEDN